MILLINSTLGGGQVEKSIYHSELVLSLNHHHINIIQGNPFNIICFFPPHCVKGEMGVFSETESNEPQHAKVGPRFNISCAASLENRELHTTNRIQRGHTERFITQGQRNLGP